MPLTMIHRLMDFSVKIGGSADAPVASANVYTDNIDQAYNVGDVAKQVMIFLGLNGFHSVDFLVPNPTGATAWVTTKLYLKSVTPATISDNKAVTAVEWGLIKRAPLTDANGKKPSETPHDSALGPEYSFDTQGGTKHITQSFSTRYRVNAGGVNGSGPNLNRAIGVSKDRVEGCDIYSGDLKWSVKVKGVPVTIDYIKTLRELTGKINDGPFYNRDHYEILFLGATGTYKAGDGWEVTYNFHEGDTQTSVNVSPDIVIDTLYPHDYIWVIYQDKVITAGDGSKFTVQVPASAFVEQVYEAADFSQLGI